MLTKRLALLSSSKILGCLTLCALLAGACKDDTPAPKPAPSAAEQAKAAQEAKIAQRVAEKRAKREAEEKAAAEAKAKTQAAVDALLVVPKKIPKKMRLAKACNQVTKAYDDFMHRLYSGKVVEQWDGGAKKMPLSMTKKKCLAGNVPVALCQLHALKNATPELKKEAPAIFRGCVDKFGDKTEKK